MYLFCIKTNRKINPSLKVTSTWFWQGVLWDLQHRNFKKIVGMNLCYELRKWRWSSADRCMGWSCKFLLSCGLWRTRWPSKLLAQELVDFIMAIMISKIRELLIEKKNQKKPTEAQLQFLWDLFYHIDEKYS